LVGTQHNRDGIGAWIEVRVNGETLWRQVMPTRSYLSQSELPVTIGLGAAPQPELVEVIWAGGATQRVEHVSVDQMTIVTEAR
jgi:enediyne biosynthesis protein E4